MKALAASLLFCSAVEGWTPVRPPRATLQQRLVAQEIAVEEFTSSDGVFTDGTKEGSGAIVSSDQEEGAPVNLYGSELVSPEEWFAKMRTLVAPTAGTTQLDATQLDSRSIILHWITYIFLSH